LNLAPGSGLSLVCADDGANDKVSCAYSLNSSSLNSNFARLSAANTYANGVLQDFSMADLRLPVAPNANPNTSGYIAFDSNSGQLRFGREGVTETVAARNVGSQHLIIQRANDSGTGTTLHRLAKLTAGGQAVRIAASDNTGILGIVTAGAGTTGNAEIAVLGIATCEADTSTTVGNYVAAATGTAGRCADAGSSFPVTGQVIGRWLSAVSPGGLGQVLLFGVGQENPRTRTALLIGANSATLGSGANGYISPSHNTFDANHDNRAFAMPLAGSAVRITYRTRTAQPGSGPLSCTLRINDVDSSLGFILLSGQAAGVYNFTGSASWNAGDLLTLRCSNTATATSAAFTSIGLEVQQ
jgi:hypothetical protein